MIKTIGITTDPIQFPLVKNFFYIVKPNIFGLIKHYLKSVYFIFWFFESSYDWGFSFSVTPRFIFLIFQFYYTPPHSQFPGRLLYFEHTTETHLFYYSTIPLL